MVEGTEKSIGVCVAGYEAIAKGPDGHFFLRYTEYCPYCGQKEVETYPYREGDCVSCGCLCPGFAYGCTSPDPITSEQLNLAIKHK
jgi:hypothetical protein